MDELTDKELFLKLKKNDEAAFENLFHKYYAPLCLFACQFQNDSQKAEGVVQEIFVNVWTKRHELEIRTSVSQYLFRAVKNHCINLIQHQQIREKYTRVIFENSINEQEYSPYFMEIDLRQKIEDSILALPAKRQEIFRMSREEGLKYREIAERLNVSVKTVETQMGLALKQLREMLRDYKDYLIGLFFFKKQSGD